MLLIRLFRVYCAASTILGLASFSFEKIYEEMFLAI